MKEAIRKAHDVGAKAGPAVAVVLTACGFFLRDVWTMAAGFFVFLLVLGGEILALRRDVVALRSQIESVTKGQRVRVPPS